MIDTLKKTRIYEMKKNICIILLLCIFGASTVCAAEPRWNVVSQRDEFNEATIYTFTLKCAGDDLLLVGYVKNDVPALSIVRAGIVWMSGNSAFPSTGDFQIKCEDGNILNKSFRSNIHWSTSKGKSSYSAKTTFEITQEANQRQRDFIELFENNKILTIKKHNDVRKFQVPSIKQAIINAGLDYAEFEEAIANEEF